MFMSITKISNSLAVLIVITISIFYCVKFIINDYVHNINLKLYNAIRVHKKLGISAGT